MQALKPPTEGRVWYADSDIGNFQVCVSHTGSRVFYRVGRVNGKMTRVRLGAYPALTVKVARDLCISINGDVAAGREVVTTNRTTRSKRTLKDEFNWWLEFVAKPNKRTWQRDERVWKRDIESRLGNKLLDSVTRPEIIEAAKHASDTYGISAGRKVIEVLGTVYSNAIVNERTTRNPAYKIPKYQSQERTRFLLPAELPAFFESLFTFRERIQDFFMLCIATGARRSNVMSMRWDELDLNAQTWTIPREKSKNKKAMLIPLVSQAVEILDRRLSDAGDNPWVFPSSASKTGHYVEPKDAWKRICNKAELKDLTIHDLRRTLASWQGSLGISLQIISQTLHHRSERTTRGYVHIVPEHLRLSVQQATDAIQNAGDQKKTEKS